MVFSSPDFQATSPHNPCQTLCYQRKFIWTQVYECQYEINKSKKENLINDDLYLSSSDDETDNESDNEIKSDNDE